MRYEKEQHIHPIGTKLYRRVNSGRIRGGYECEIKGYARGSLGNIRGYVLHWKWSNSRNEWSVDGVHEKMNVYSNPMILPEDLFTI